MIWIESRVLRAITSKCDHGSWSPKTKTNGTRADVVVIPHSSRVRSKATITASMTESFANGSEADAPDLVWLSDLYLLLRHLHKANKGMPGLYYYHKHGPDAGTGALLGLIWAEWSSRNSGWDTKGLLAPKLSFKSFLKCICTSLFVIFLKRYDLSKGSDSIDHCLMVISQCRADFLFKRSHRFVFIISIL